MAMFEERTLALLRRFQRGNVIASKVFRKRPSYFLVRHILYKSLDDFLIAFRDQLGASTLVNRRVNTFTIHRF